VVLPSQLALSLMKLLLLTPNFLFFAPGESPTELIQLRAINIGEVMAHGTQF
jgi:hypothetical protein